MLDVESLMGFRGSSDPMVVVSVRSSFWLKSSFQSDDFQRTDLELGIFDFDPLDGVGESQLFENSVCSIIETVMRKESGCQD